MDSHFHGNDIRSNEIAALSSKVRNDKGIKTNNIYLQMGEKWKGFVRNMTQASIKPQIEDLCAQYQTCDLASD